MKIEKRINSSFYRLGVLSLITAIIWIITGIYTALTNDSKIEVDKKVLAPFSENINEQVLQQLLQNRNY